MDLALLESTLAGLGEPGYRARQVWRWTAQGVDGFDAMTDLPQALRGALRDSVPFSSLTVEHEAHARDGTIKALFATHDGRPVEAVLMRYRDGRNSLCLSSQSGCPLTCSFCATGRMRFAGNLSADEILDQALHFRRVGELDHAVFMGMGEPMMNLDAVLEACTLLPSLGITNRRTAISTVGWIPGIERLTASGLPIRLAEIPGHPFGADALIAGMAQDKKAQAGALTFVLVRAIGDAFIAKGVDPAPLRDFLIDEGALP